MIVKIGKSCLDTVKRIADWLIHSLAWNFMGRVLLWCQGNKNRKLVKLNKAFYNKYAGKRCFIVGNGPSVNKQDLSYLENEYVFTVNQMMRDERFPMLKSDFHVIADPLYFNLDLSNEYNKKIVELLKKITTENNRPECFFPLQAKPFIDKLQLDNLSINYFFPVFNIYDNYDKKIDYTKPVPGFYNVVQYAVTLAIYCGFSEIYLLGCDMTGYREVEENTCNNYEDKHCYHLTEEEKKNVLHKGRTCEEYFNGFAHMFSDYRRLAEYTADRGIKLVNVTEGGVLDSLPREKYEDIISAKESRN